MKRRRRKFFLRVSGVVGRGMRGGGVLSGFGGPYGFGLERSFSPYSCLVEDCPFPSHSGCGLWSRSGRGQHYEW